MVTSLIMCFIKYVCRVPLRMSDEMLEVGDYAIHGEEPYTFAHYNRSLMDGGGQKNVTATAAEYQRAAGDDSEKGSNPSEILHGRDPHERGQEIGAPAGMQDPRTEIKLD